LQTGTRAQRGSEKAINIGHRRFPFLSNTRQNRSYLNITN